MSCADKYVVATYSDLFCGLSYLSEFELIQSRLK
jgi:hypothetical protein